MKLTKYEHACFTLEKDEQLIVIDPGIFSSDFLSPERVIAVIITHEHADHFDPERVAAIIDKNPDAIIIGPKAVTSQIQAFETKTVVAGETLQFGPFMIGFFGGEHASIHPSIPLVANLGVLINDLLYYPGDSLTIPTRPVDTLAIPIAGPWLKTSEAIDFLAAIHPRLAFPTHDAVLSDEGKEITDAHLITAAHKADVLYQRITDSINI
jgi:L-ascorbate metabolism protein UlaG (beta-lactamase superfamily)